PDVLEDGIEGSVLPGNHLELGGTFEPAEETGSDAGIAVGRRDVNRVEVPAGDLACVPDRLFGRGIETLDVDDDLVAWLAGENGRAASTKPPPDSSVVLSNGEEHEHDDRDGDDDHPGAVSELRRDQN